MRRSASSSRAWQARDSSTPRSKRPSDSSSGEVAALEALHDRFQLGQRRSRNRAADQPSRSGRAGRVAVLRLAAGHRAGEPAVLEAYVNGITVAGAMRRPAAPCGRRRRSTPRSRGRGRRAGSARRGGRRASRSAQRGAMVPGRGRRRQPALGLGQPRPQARQAPALIDGGEALGERRRAAAAPPGGAGRGRAAGAPTARRAGARGSTTRRLDRQQAAARCRARARRPRPAATRCRDRGAGAVIEVRDRGGPARRAAPRRSRRRSTASRRARRRRSRRSWCRSRGRRRRRPAPARRRWRARPPPR